MTTQTSVSQTPTSSTEPVNASSDLLVVEALAAGTFQPLQAVSVAGTKFFDWSNSGNWSSGAVPSSQKGLANVVLSAGTAGVSLDNIASLTIDNLSFMTGAAALEIAAADTLFVTGSVANGAIKLDAGARLLETNGGLSYVNLSGNGSMVEMGGVPQGYVQFSTATGTTGSLYIEQPQARTATSPGLDHQVIQNFALGDNIFVEDAPAGALSVTYTPGSGAAGTLMISAAGVPVYEFNNFDGNSNLNYQVARTAITDPLTGHSGVAALDISVSSAPKSASSPASVNTPSTTPGITNTTPVAGAGSTSSTTPSSPPPPPPSPPPVSTGPVTTGPVVPQASGAGQVVDLVLQNPTTVALGAREITFGQEFAEGQVAAGAQLVAMIGGVAVAVQMDVKTINPDGSVAMAVLTMEQPAIAAGAATPVMLALAPTGTAAGTPVNIAALAATGSSYNLQVNLTLHNADGTTTPVIINAAQALAAALKSGAYTTWLSGPQATQVRIDVPVAGSLHVTLDITDYADGTTATDVTFNNDIAMTASGGTAVYDATITQNGKVAFQQNAITQYQYTSWDQTFASNGAPAVNVQHDIAALEKTGLIQNYDLSTGVDTSLIASETTQMAAPGFNAVLGTAGITQDMPAQGGRWDIGPTTNANTIWLMTQNATAAQYALAQATDAGSIPWHLYSPASGTYLTATANPTLWADPRGGPGTAGTTGLTQQMPTAAQTGWSPDPAHQPDLDYVAYLMTGDQDYLDELNAQASYDILSMRPNTNEAGVVNGREGALGIVADGSVQVRQQAWSLREIVEAAAANPTGSAEKAYFTQVENNNFNHLLSYVGTLTEGQATGWIPGSYTAGLMGPWQQDYLATTVVLAAEQGNAAATQFLGWETNFLAGVFLNAANGLSPYLGTAYNLSTDVAGESTVTSALQTWSAISTATLATGVDGANANTALSQAYAEAARAALAGDITVTGDVRAIQAFGWISAYEQINAAYMQEGFNPTLDIAPRLADGNLLTANNVLVSADTIARVVAGSATADQLIYETGGANVTLQGGAGINILFAGTGADTLLGGADNDYLFAGSGADTLSAGAGINYMQAGSGADTFVLDATQAASDTIADFKLGIDHLHVLGVGGTALGAAAIASLIAGATADGVGGSVLHLSATHTVDLAGISAAHLAAVGFS